MLIGYGLCGPDEKYLRSTLDCFKKLCDRVIILLNNATQKDLIKSYGFDTVEDNREWGKWQWLIKQDFYQKHVLPLKPDWCLPLDMDEVMLADRPTLDALMAKGGAGYYCYLLNLIDNGYSPRYSFWNVRLFNASIDPKWEQRALHCGLAPKDAYRQGNYAPLIVEHYGLKDKADRNKKIARYEQYDPEAKYKGRAYYDWLKNPDIKPLINKQKEVDAFVADTHFKEYKHMEKDQKFYYIKTVDGRILDIPESALADELFRGSELISKDPIIKTAGPVATTIVEEPAEQPMEEVKQEEKKPAKKTVKKVKRVKKNA